MHHTAPTPVTQSPPHTTAAPGEPGVYHEDTDQRGLEYLFGTTTEDEGTETFHTFWAHDRAQERQALEDFADFATAHHNGDHESAQQILDDIAVYNRDDCHSTARLRDWLETLREEHGVTDRPLLQLEITEEEAERARKRAEAQQRLAANTHPLRQHLPAISPPSAPPPTRPAPP